MSFYDALRFANWLHHGQPVGPQGPATTEAGAYASVWVTQTGCMGICPRRGATVALYPEQRIFTEVEAEDALRLYEKLVAPSLEG